MRLLAVVLVATLTASAEEPVRVSFCDLGKDRKAYDHQLVEVTAFVSHGFEDFTLFDPRCADDSVWLEYGGTFSSGTIYCCGVGSERSRSEPMEIDGIRIPLQKDAKLRELDRLIRHKPDAIAHATLVGHFFAEEGFGHFGMHSLLAIERVISVDPPRRDLDMRASFEPPSSDCYRDLPFKSADILQAQRDAESGTRAWSFTDPKRVAEEAVGRALTEVGRAQGRVMFQTMPRSTKPAYWLVVAKPYWLSFFASDPKRVAWVVIGGYELDCSGASQSQ